MRAPKTAVLNRQYYIYYIIEMNEGNLFAEKYKCKLFKWLCIILGKVMSEFRRAYS